MTTVVNNLPDRHPDLEVHIYGDRDPVITINRGGVFVARITLAPPGRPGPPAAILLAQPHQQRRRP